MQASKVDNGRWSHSKYLPVQDHSLQWQKNKMLMIRESYTTQHDLHRSQEKELITKINKKKKCKIKEK